MRSCSSCPSSSWVHMRSTPRNHGSGSQVGAGFGQVAVGFGRASDSQCQHVLFDVMWGEIWTWPVLSSLGVMTESHLEAQLCSVSVYLPYDERKTGCGLTCTVMYIQCCPRVLLSTVSDRPTTTCTCPTTTLDVAETPFEQVPCHRVLCRVVGRQVSHPRLFIPCGGAAKLRCKPCLS